MLIWRVKKMWKKYYQGQRGLIGVSFLILFLELLVVRLVGTEIRIFAYLSNLVLLAAFIGSGMGMLIKRRLSPVVSMAGVLVLTMVLKTNYIVRLPRLEFKLFSGISELLSPIADSYIWLKLDTYSRSGMVIGIGLTILLFLLLLVLFMPLGQILGQELNKSRQPLLAYSFNVAASIGGMWAFSLMSFGGLSPYLGLGLVLFGLVWLVGRDKELMTYWAICMVGTAVLLLPQNSGKQPFQQPVTFWSPYQKLTLSLVEKDKVYKPDGWYLEVNNVGYMGLLDLSKEAVERGAALVDPVLTEKGWDKRFSNQYDLPYMVQPGAKKVLIIGGGGGNDAAAAVRAGIPQVDVVEIDPQIIAIGKKYHPEKPYSQPTVHVYNDDGRAFIQNGGSGYDVVVMSLADSHTLNSSLTNLQLDNYLYTVESLKQVRKILNDKGILFLSFEVPKLWIGSRMQETVKQAFGVEPRVFEVRSEGAYGWGGVVFLVGKNGAALDETVALNEPLAAYISEHRADYPGEPINPLTDDWPYTYLDKPRLPLLQLVVAVIIGVTMLAIKGRVFAAQKLDWGFAALGAGFMLYEFQNISKSSLWFGNTWVTNLFIITGVLVFVLLANWVIAKREVEWKWIVVGMLASLGMQLLVPLTWFYGVPQLVRNLVVVVFLSSPHFFSALMFAYLLKRARVKSVAFGSNLLGSAVGGLIQILSFVWGIQALLWVTIGFYGLGAYWKRK